MNFESTTSDDVLDYGVDILKKIYKMAKRKEDTTLMLAIADRLMMLYESMSDIEKQRKHLPAGFARVIVEEDNGRS